MHVLTNLEFRFVISDFLPYVFLLSIHAYDEKYSATTQGLAALFSSNENYAHNISLKY